MNDKTNLKLLKPKNSSTKQKYEEKQIPILIDSKEYFESNTANEKYLRDFYQLYRFYEDIFRSTPNSKLLLLFRSIDDAIMGLIQLNYENEIVKNEGIPLKDILKSNKEFVEKMKIEITKYKSNPHKSYIDEVYFSEVEEAIIQNSTNSIDACIYKSEILDRIDEAKVRLNNNFFDLLSQKGLSLGTKTPSKGKKKNINSLLAKIYYEIICNGKLSHEFIEAYDKKKDINNCSYPIKILFSKIDNEKLSSFRGYVEERDIVVEALLLMYIVNDSIYKYKTNVLEKYYNQDELDDLSQIAIDEVNNGIDNMYLKIRFESEFLNK